tara:strand:- start:105587 stop:105703 length:117 start_codon:yes stop_codon:yes gene_type:complete
MGFSGISESEKSFCNSSRSFSTATMCSCRKPARFWESF